MFKGTPDVQNQLAFAKKEHLFNVAMVFCMTYKLQATSSLFIDPNGRKTYNPARNDPFLNIHNPTMLSIWRANVDCQPILCKHVVLKYISKYASKAEPKLETYHAILSRLAHAAPSDSPILQPIKEFLAQTVAKRNISAQETCKMLQ